MPLDQEPEQVEGALEGGARVCGDEAEVRICEATLSRTEEECHPTVRGVRAGESVLGAEKTVALGTGLARERRLLITGEPPKQAEDRKKPNPSACTGLAEHLLPRRHGLIQSFLRLSAANSGSLHSFSPIRVAAFFQTNCSANRRGSSAAGTHTFDFQFSAKNDLLSIHALRQNERRLANLAGAWFFRIEIASNFNFAV